MADCYAPEADDLHRRWLPREIFADIGIVDTDPAAADAAMPDAAAVDIEELAVQLAGILGANAGAGGKGKAAPRAPPPPPPAPIAAPRHGAQVCGLEKPAPVAYGGGNGGGAAAAWAPPLMTYTALQWEVPTNFANAGAALNYPMLPPPPPCVVPPPAGPKLRGGTGVFLPRADAYRHAPRLAAKDVKGPSPTKALKPVPPPQKEEVAAAGKWQKVQQKAAAALPVHARREAAAALPQDWSYH